MSFQIKIKEKFFHNKHDKNKTNVLKNINITIKPKEFVGKGKGELDTGSYKQYG